MPDKKTQLGQIIAKLIERGDDAEELLYWEEIFDTLDERQQEELVTVLEKELQTLEKF
jgi:hypothetical protein